MIKYMDNMRLAAETLQHTSKKIESSIQEIRRTGVFEEASELLRVSRKNRSSVSGITTAVKEMQVSQKKRVCDTCLSLEYDDFKSVRTNRKRLIKSDKEVVLPLMMIDDDRRCEKENATI